MWHKAVTAARLTQEMIERILHGKNVLSFTNLYMQSTNGFYSHIKHGSNP